MRYLSVLFTAALIAASAATLPGRYIVEFNNPPAAHAARQARAAHRKALIADHANVRVAVEQRGAEVTGETTTVANTIFVRVPEGSTADLESLAGVKRVYAVQIRKPMLDHALPLEKVPDAWNQIGGMQNAGVGIKIGIIDTGIDVNHPAFNDPSLTVPPGFPLANQDSDLAYTNQKIIVARAYTDTPRSAYNANDSMGHGTGVAMTAAGLATAGPYGTITGVAPKAFLGNYKVFPDGGQGASDDVILQAIDDAIADGMDVINLSLGITPSPRPQDDPLVLAIEGATAAGVIVTIAAGNDGSDPGSVASPGTAPDAITVGSSDNDRLFAGTVTPDGGDALPAIPGSGPSPTFPLTASLVDVTNLDPTGLACGPLPAGSLSGAIALILRGTCTFETKIDNAQQAGAVAVVIYTYSLSPDPITMAAGAATLPAIMVGYDDGSALKQRADAGALNVTLNFALQPLWRNPARISSYSAAGPNTDLTIKPDLLAIGSTISNAAPLSQGGYVVESGTSFSSPMLAGAAALLKAARPGLTFGEYRSLLIDSASPFAGGSSVQQTGTGLLNMLSAVTNTVTALPVSISFGQGGTTVNRTAVLALTNIGSAADTLSITVSPIKGIGSAPTVTPNPVQIGAGQTQPVLVSFSGTGLTPGAYEGTLQIQSTQSAVTTVVPYWYGIASQSPQFLTLLSPPTSGAHASRQSIFFRISDAAGLDAQATAATAVSSGGGTVLRTISVDDEFPGVYEMDVRLGPRAGTNVFTISVGNISKTVTIQGT